MQLVSISKYINESQLRSNGNRYPNRNSKENSILKYHPFFFLDLTNYLAEVKKCVLSRSHWNHQEIQCNYYRILILILVFKIIHISISAILVIIDFSKFLIVDVPTQCMTTSFSYQRISVKISCTKTSGCPQQNAYEH